MVIGTVVPVAGIHRAAVPALGLHDREPCFGIGALLRRHRVPDGGPFARKERRQAAPVDLCAVDAVPEGDAARVAEAAVERDAVALVIFAARRVARDRVPDRLVDAEGVGDAEAGNVDAIEAGLIRPPGAVIEAVNVGRRAIGEVGGVDQAAVAGQVGVAVVGAERRAYRHLVPFPSAARRCRRTALATLKVRPSSCGMPPMPRSITMSPSVKPCALAVTTPGLARLIAVMTFGGLFRLA